VADRSTAPDVIAPATGGRPGVLRRFLSVLGPGVITGAADDDPSGIATYSIAGAQLGTSLLWTACLTWPLMAVVQMTCARLGMVTGQGLAGALRKKWPRWAVVLAVASLFVANTINVGADLVGMADAAEALSGVDSRYFVLGFGVAITWATIRLQYYQIVCRSRRQRRGNRAAECQAPMKTATGQLRRTARVTEVAKRSRMGW